VGHPAFLFAHFFIAGELCRREYRWQLTAGSCRTRVLHFVLACVLWFFLLGWIIHLWSILDAALWKPKEQPVS